MSRESELQAELAAKTKDFERIRNEKEAAEEAMRIHVQNLDLAQKISYIQKCLDSTTTDEMKQRGWSFVFGKYEKGNDSYIQFKDEWIITFPNDPDIFTNLIAVIKETLENKKNILKEI